MNHERAELVARVKATAAGASTESDLLKTTAELIHNFSDGYSWTGFYMMQDDHLEVGPYFGPTTEHTKIGLDQGICGAAASRKKTVTVDDVRADSRFIACSLSTRSEIVVPLMDGDTCLGEIDIDSDHPSFFTDDDRVMLEAIAELVVQQLRKLRATA